MTTPTTQPTRGHSARGARPPQTGHGRAAIASTKIAADALRSHPHADRLVPAMTTAEYRSLREDIKTRGVVLVPLEVTPEGVVLDGHHRLKAARELRISTLPVRVVEPEDDTEHIILCALLRRQLTPSQRAALAIELSDYQQAKAKAKTRSLRNLRQNQTEAATLPPRGKTRDRAAALAGASGRTVQDAATVQAHDPALFERIKTGEIAANTAANRVRRRLRDDSIGPPPPIPEGPFQLIYADPPWQLGNPDGPNAPERHYPTMPLDEIAALRIPAADSAVLLIWAVNGLLPEALHVITRWGFNYKTNLVWVKPSKGLGNWARNRHELLLLATRGQPPLPDTDRRPDSVIEAARGRHSEKPQTVYDLIETGWPTLTRLELFARNPRPGWEAWGNELSKATAAA